MHQPIWLLIKPLKLAAANGQPGGCVRKRTLARSLVVAHPELVRLIDWWIFGHQDVEPAKVAAARSLGQLEAH